MTARISKTASERRPEVLRLAARGGLTDVVLVDIASIELWSRGTSAFAATIDALVETANVGGRRLVFVGGSPAHVPLPHVWIASSATLDDLFRAPAMMPVPPGTQPSVVAADLKKNAYLFACLTYDAENILDIADGRLWDRDSITGKWGAPTSQTPGPAPDATALTLAIRSPPLPGTAYVAARLHRTDAGVMIDELAIEDGERRRWVGHTPSLAALGELVAKAKDRPIVATSASELLAALCDGGMPLPDRMYDPALACMVLDPDRPLVPPGLPSELRSLLSPERQLDVIRPDTYRVLDGLPSLHDELLESLQHEQLLGIYEDDVCATLPALAQIEREGFLVDATNINADIAHVYSEMRLAEQQILQGLSQSQADAFRAFDLLKGPVEELGTLVQWSASTHLLPGWKDDRYLFERYVQFGDQRAVALRRLRGLDAVHGWLLKLSDKKRFRARLVLQTTGRLYQNDGATFNMPKHSPEGLLLRKHLVAPPGEVFVGGDYKAFEPRLLAHVIGDPGLVHACGSGDFYDNLAPILGLQLADRPTVKKAMLSLAYSVTARRFAAELPWPLPRGHQVHRDLERHLKATVDYRDQFVAAAIKAEEARSLFGWRRRWQPDVSRQVFKRQAFNLLAQGSAADVLRLLLRELRRVLPPEAVLVHQEFDSVILRCPVALEAPMTSLLKKTMESVVSLTVPLEARIKSGPTLADVS